MNLSPEWVALLRTHGHNALHWRDVGGAGASDGEILTRAAELGRIVLPADLDFGAMAASGSPSLSVVQLKTRNTNPARVGGFIADAIAQASDGLLTGAILTIEPARSRLRPLPTGPENP